MPAILFIEWPALSFNEVLFCFGYRLDVGVGSYVIIERGAPEDMACFVISSLHKEQDE
jgi:hypothetical protein